MSYSISMSGTMATAARTGVVIAVLILQTFAAAPAQTTFTVNSTDDVDDGNCDGTHCSLREAITAANGSAGANIIAFSIPGPGLHTIRPASELPSLTDSITVDGTTEPDFAGTPVVELDGSNAGAAQGLQIVGSQNTVRGLVINRFEANGILVTGPDNVIEGNYIGTNAAGDAAAPNEAGVILLASGNTVGGSTDGAGNVISGNMGRGVDVGPGVTGTAIAGNFIGTDATGSTSLGNQLGVWLNQAPNNTIGGTAPGSRNVISGNNQGVLIWESASTGNQVIGNYIGTNAAGDAAVPNTIGVLVMESASGNTVGGSTAGAGNVISGNTDHGIDLGPGTTGTVVKGNYIGTDATGSTDIGNDIGVFVNDSPANTIGGTEEGARNVISGNREGVTFWDSGSTENEILGNYIGTDAAGDAAIPNVNGVVLYGPGNIVGGSVEGARNVISGNSDHGVDIASGTTGTRVEGNYIGTDAAGSAKVGNDIGVFVNDAADNMIGGTEAGAGNVISGNREGVQMVDPGATGNQVLGNHIGTDAAGIGDLGNSGAGVVIWDGALDNSIGGPASGAGNVIAYNHAEGIALSSVAGTGNMIRSNSIFSNGWMGIDLGGDGVTPNDDGDVDTGPNDFQNSPILSVQPSGGVAAITAELNSTPNTTFTIEFFSNTICDDSGYGEGETILGTATLMTDAAGNGSTMTTFSGSLPPGIAFTATATDGNGNTSEFSQCAAIASFVVAIEPTTRTIAAGESATYTVTVSAEGGAFEEEVSLSCLGLPEEATCGFSEDAVVPGTGEANSVLTLTTTARSQSVLTAPLWRPRGTTGLVWIGLVFLAALAAAGQSSKHMRQMPRLRLALFFALVLTLLQVACGDDETTAPSGGTPAGTYEITVTGTWGSMERSATATLDVE